MDQIKSLSRLVQARRNIMWKESCKNSAYESAANIEVTRRMLEMESLIPENALKALRGLGLSVATGWSIRTQEKRKTLLLIWEEESSSNTERNSWERPPPTYSQGQGGRRDRGGRYRRWPPPPFYPQRRSFKDSSKPATKPAPSGPRRLYSEVLSPATTTEVKTPTPTTTTTTTSPLMFSTPVVRKAQETRDTQVTPIALPEVKSTETQITPVAEPVAQPKENRGTQVTPLKIPPFQTQAKKPQKTKGTQITPAALPVKENRGTQVTPVKAPPQPAPQEKSKTAEKNVEPSATPQWASYEILSDDEVKSRAGQFFYDLSYNLGQNELWLEKEAAVNYLEDFRVLVHHNTIGLHGRPVGKARVKRAKSNIKKWGKEYAGMPGRVIMAVNQHLSLYHDLGNEPYQMKPETEAWIMQDYIAPGTWNERRLSIAQIIPPELLPWFLRTIGHRS